jgi:hypothetical protein
MKREEHVGVFDSQLQVKIFFRLSERSPIGKCHFASTNLRIFDISPSSSDAYSVRIVG